MQKYLLGRKSILLMVGLMGIALMLGGTPALAEEKIEGSLHVESWGGTYAEAVKNFIIEPFKKKYGVEVTHGFFGNNNEQLAKLQAGKTAIDVSFLSQNFVYRAKEAGLLLPVRVENVPNYQKLYDIFKKPAYDPGPEVYCISYFWGDTAVAWNTKYAKEPVSWNALWDPRYKGHVALYNGPDQAITQTAIILGQDPNNITDYDAIMAKLKALKPNLLKFWSSGAELTSLFATGEVWIADFWRGRVNNLKRDGHPVQYTQPKEGSIGWVDTIVIPKGAKNRRAAEAFLDFALNKDVHTQFVTKGITYAPCSSLVELTPEQSDLLGASPKLREKVVFLDPGYQQKNTPKWTTLMNELMAGQ